MIKKILINACVLLRLISVSQTTNPAPYCNSVITATMMGENSSITNVQIGTLNNTTGFAEGGSRYHYYNNLAPGIIVMGVPTVLSITLGGSIFFEPGYYAAYVDFNMDNVFGATELVSCNAYTGGGILGAAASTRTIGLVVNPGTPGIRRLRVIRGESPNNSPVYNPNYTLSPCPVANPNFYFGEVEDYNIDLVLQPAPVASFSINQDMAVCVGQNVNVINNTTNNPGSWTWTATGANPANANVQTPVFSYSTPGTYTITLAASNFGGTSASYSRTLTVFPNPTITLAASVTGNNANGLLCRGKTATLSVNGATTYTWNTGSNSTSIIISPTTTTNYTVTGKSSNGCKSTAVRTLSVVVCTGFEGSIADDFGVNVFPNPNNGLFKITLHGASEKMRVEVYDLIGNLIFMRQLEEENSFDLRELKSGVYFFNITNEREVFKTRVVITN